MFWPEGDKRRQHERAGLGLSECPPLKAGGKEALTEYRTYASFYDSINWPFATQTEAVRNTLLHNPAHVANKSKEFV